MKITNMILPKFLAAALLFSALAGCNRGADDTSNVAPVAVPTGSKSAAPPVKLVGKPGTQAPIKMTASQAMGVDILKALNATPSMKGHQVSVGTTSDTVILQGKVKNAAQKKTAETIARQKAKTAKITNKIEVTAK
jgi:hypothetical protein